MTIFARVSNSAAVGVQRTAADRQRLNSQVAAVVTLIAVPVVVAGWLAWKSLTRGLTLGAAR